MFFLMRNGFLIAVLVSAVCGVPGVLRAQQAESISTEQTQQPPEVKEFQGLEDQWSNAVVKNDQYTMEFLLSPMYVDISSTGDVLTRNQLIAGLSDKGSEPVSMLQRVVSVREFGDTAIVSGTYIVKYRANSGVKEERGIFTHVYNRSRMHWACVNAQRTAVVDLTAGKQKASKKSDAPEPFHIPLFYKGAEPTQSAAGQKPNSPGPN
jgi:ketosteroid isomerase-like protein